MRKLKILFVMAALSAVFLMPFSSLAAAESKSYQDEKIFKDEIIRTYTFSPEEKGNIEESFTKYDKSAGATKYFKLATKDVKEEKKEEKKVVSETRSFFDLSSNDGSGIPEITPYDTGAFKGELKRISLNYEPLTILVSWTEEEEVETVSKTYANLANADYINVPKTVEENGGTYYLLTYDASQSVNNLDIFGERIDG